MNEWRVLILSWFFRGVALISYYINFTEWYSKIIFTSTLIILILIDFVLVYLLRNKRLYMNQSIIFHITITLFLGIFLITSTFCMVELNNKM